MSAGSPDRPVFHGTTIVAVRRDGRVAVAGDGQVSLGATMVKQTARKVRRLHDGRVIVGIAGATADAMSLCEKLESRLKEFNGNLARAAVELAKQWRTDKFLRHLEAMLIAASDDRLLLVGGSGDVIEPDEDALAIGSGAPSAQAAALALLRHTALDAETIAREAVAIAATIDIYTNDRIVVESLALRSDGPSEAATA